MFFLLTSSEVSIGDLQSPLRAPKKRLAFHPRAQQTVDRGRDAQI